MADQNTTVTVEGMGNAISSLNDAHTRISSHRSSVQGHLDGLRGAWSGEAATVFQQAGEAWLSNMDSVLASLATLTGQVEQSRQTYGQTHQGTVDAASQANSVIASGLPGI